MATKKSVVPKSSTVKKNPVKAVEPSYLCPYCGHPKKKTDFYNTSDPLVLTGVTHMCKECAKKIARNYDPQTGIYGECTRTSVQEALERLDKPFLESVWITSSNEFKNANNKSTSVWEIYMRYINNQAYKTMRWRDSDTYTIVKDSVVKDMQAIDGALPTEEKSQEINLEYSKNREDIVRLIGYDPFLSESEEDKPLLYSQLLGYLDLGGDGNDDMMRTSSAISIVRGFLQVAKIDNMISALMSDPIRMGQNVGTIKSLQDAKKNINSTITSLAAESCLSLKNSKTVGKGDNTWTGKIKKLKDLNLREAEVNGFDLATCKGMQQVMDLSNASILRQLRLDESEYSDIVAEQRQMITNLSNEKESYKEISRILLRENLDLKDTLKENGILDDSTLVNLEELFSPFSETIEEDEEADYENEE